MPFETKIGQIFRFPWIKMDYELTETVKIVSDTGRPLG